MAKFIRAQNDPTVYQDIGGGQLRAVSSPEEFKRLSGTDDINGATQTVASLSDYDRQNAQQYAGSQVDPALRSQVSSLQDEKDQAVNQNNRVTQSIADVYRRRRENDPLAKQGIASGAALDYNAYDEGRQVSQAGSDLSAQLSSIARRLTDANANADQQKNSLVNTLAGQYAQNRQDNLYNQEDRTYLRDQRAQADTTFQNAQEDRTYNKGIQQTQMDRSKASDVSSIFLQFLQAGQPVPQQLYDLIRNSYGA